MLVADGAHGVMIYDNSMPTDVRVLEKKTVPGNARDIFVKTDEYKAYVVWPDGTLWAFDLLGYTEAPTLAEGGYATPNPFLPNLGQKVFLILEPMIQVQHLK